MIQATLVADLGPLHTAGARAKASPARDAQPMRKIVLLVAAAIVIFMAFTTYSVLKAVQGSAQLAAIKDRYFPLLQRLDANIVRLDKIQDLYIQVVITGDRDSISKAAKLGVQADDAFGEIAALYPGHEAAVGHLRSDLSQYQALANQASLAFLNQDREAAAPMAARMNRSLAEVGARLKAFRQATYDDFAQTLADSQHDSKVRLLMGLGLGVMNLGFMAVLVFFIRNNMRMMEIIAQQNATLEGRVAERTAQLSRKTSDINAMLQNMTLGVSTVVPGNLIHPEYSSHLRTIFNMDDLGGKDLIASLFGKSTLGVDTKDQIAVALGSILDEDAMMFALNGHLLTREMRLDLGGDTHKIVQMDWSPIVGEHGVVDKVLLITQDVTHLRELEASSAQQREELAIISRIIKISIGKFNAFIKSARGYAADSRRRIEAGDRGSDTVDALFRNMHTIKGNARMFEFTQITNAAHQAEQTYDGLRKDVSAQWAAADLLRELDAVDAAISWYTEISEDKLGRKGRASDLLTTQGVFVGNDQLAELRSLVSTRNASGAVESLALLQSKIEGLGLIEFARVVSGSADSLSSLSKELGKPTPAVRLEGCDVALNSRAAEALKSALMHMLRNSLDHGIEPPAERILAHKPEQGTVRIIAVRAGERIELHISDDGRGLALHKLYDRGLTEGAFGDISGHPTRQAVAEIIFRPGLSTSQEVTQVSGRGVGMDAVRTFLNEQEASIRIALEDPTGTHMDFAPVEFIIEIPLSACRN